RLPSRLQPNSAMMERYFSLDSGATRLYTVRVDEIKLSKRECRALHLVDIENLAGGAHSSPEEMRSAITEYIRVAGFGAGDQMVVASSHHAAPAAWFA